MSIFYCLFIDSTVKRTILHIHCMNLILRSATTFSNIYCNKPMHLSGLGNKFGVKIIINAIKTPDKEPAFSPLNGN